MIQQTSLDTGIIYIKSHPPGAEVFINGDFYSQTPLRLEAVEPGVHEYLLRMPGYEDYKGQIYVESNKVSPEFAIMSTGNKSSLVNLGNNNYQVQSLQNTAPPPTPGYIIMPERTVIYVLGGIVIALFAIMVFGKRRD